ncbi:MAG: hypothetical protein ABIH03_13500, partial [Pseudomonadota bacterium]
NWIENNEKYTPDGGSATAYMTADRMIMLPADLTDIFEFAKGVDVVPGDSPGASDFADFNVVQMGDLDYILYADYSAKDPPGVKIIAVTNFCPIIRNPNAVLFVTTTG